MESADGWSASDFCLEGLIAERPLAVRALGSHRSKVGELKTNWATIELPSSWQVTVEENVLGRNAWAKKEVEEAATRLSERIAASDSLKHNSQHFEGHLALWLVGSGLYEQIWVLAQQGVAKAGKQALESDEFFKFILMTLHTAAFNVPVEEFYSITLQSSEFGPKPLLTEQRFMDILNNIWPISEHAQEKENPFQMFQKCDVSNNESSISFKLPFATISGVEVCRNALASFSKFASTLCFTRNTVVSMNERVSDLSPGKWSGTQTQIHTLKAASIATGFILGETIRFSENEESYSEQIIRTLQPVLNIRQEWPPAERNEVLVCLDHGLYNDAATETLLDLHCVPFGAITPSKASFPFSAASFRDEYSPCTPPLCGVIHPDQPSMAWLARRPVSTAWSAYALACTDGCGNLSFLHSLNDDRIRPESWSYVVDMKREYARQTLEKSSQDFRQLWDEAKNRFIQLTMVHGSEDWSLLKFGRMTGGDVERFLLGFALRFATASPSNTDNPTSSSFLPEPVVQSILFLLQCLKVPDKILVEVEENGATNHRHHPFDGSFTETQLNAVKLNDLAGIAKSFGIRGANHQMLLDPKKKKEVIRTIQTCTSNDVSLSCLGSSIQLAMSAGETAKLSVQIPILDGVRKIFPAYLLQNDIATRVTSVKEIGLSHAPLIPSHCTVADGVILFDGKDEERMLEFDSRFFPSQPLNISDSSSNWAQTCREAWNASMLHGKRTTEVLRELTLAAIEIKCWTLKKEIDEQNRLVHRLGGSYSTCILDPSSPNWLSHCDEFEACVPCRSDRIQILQHSALGVQDVFYVNVQADRKSSAGKIIRVVRVRISPVIIARLGYVVGFIGGHHMRWVWDEDAQTPSNDVLNKFSNGWGITASHIKHRRALALGILNERLRLGGKLLPPAKQVIPRLMNWWFASKWCTDLQVKVPQYCVPGKEPLSHVTRTLLQLVFSACSNAKISLNLYKLVHSPGCVDSLRSANELQNQLSKGGSLRSMLLMVETQRLGLIICRVHPDPKVLFPTNVQVAVKSVVLKGQDTAPVEVELVPILDGEAFDPVNNDDHRNRFEAVAKAVADCKSSLRSRAQILNTPDAKFLRSCSYLSSKHLPTPIPLDQTDKARQRGSCWLCCSSCENQKIHNPPGRKAFETASWCMMCGGIPLCTVKRKLWGGLSCFDVFHDKRVDTVWSGIPSKGFCPCRNSSVSFGRPFAQHGQVAGHAILDEMPHFPLHPGLPDILPKKKRRRRNNCKSDNTDSNKGNSSSGSTDQRQDIDEDNNDDEILPQS